MWLGVSLNEKSDESNVEAKRCGVRLKPNVHCGALSEESSEDKATKERTNHCLFKESTHSVRQLSGVNSV